MICFKILEAPIALPLTIIFVYRGNAMLAIIAITTTVIISSTSVKPFLFLIRPPRQGLVDKISRHAPGAVGILYETDGLDGLLFFGKNRIKDHNARFFF